MGFPDDGEVSDEDSDDSDNDEGCINHLGRQVLAAPCSLRFTNDDNADEEEDVSISKASKNKRKKPKIIN